MEVFSVIIAKKLFNIKQKLEPLKRDKQGYGYKYADIVQICDVSDPLLVDEGILLVQSHEWVKGEQKIVTQSKFVDVASGEVESTFVPTAVEKMNPQGTGAAITYGRKYGQLNALGMVQQGEDSDGVVASDNVNTSVTSNFDQVQGSSIVAAQQVFPEAVVTESVDTSNASTFVVGFGKYKGKSLGMIKKSELVNYVDWLESDGVKTGKAPTSSALALIENAKVFLGVENDVGV